MILPSLLQDEDNGGTFSAQVQTELEPFDSVVPLQIMIIIPMMLKWHHFERMMVQACINSSGQTHENKRFQNFLYIMKHQPSTGFNRQYIRKRARYFTQQGKVKNDKSLFIYK